jgi:hypothetical protein
MRNSLPPGLKASGPITSQAWDRWARSRDKEIRSRLHGGEEDTLTNLLRLGVTYTKQKRILFGDLVYYGKMPAVDSAANHRADDLIRALAGSPRGEGMMEMRAFLQKEGFDLHTPAGREKLRAYLLANLTRERDEVLRWAKQISGTDPNLYQAFRTRGISTDTDIYPDYLIELHLRQMMAKGLLKPDSVHRVAIVGPGLDFVNKNSGTDFYPPQTTQPFAVIDSLARLGLANPATIQLYTFDISPRVNRHIASARASAHAGRPYIVQLLCTPESQWEAAYTTGFLNYWQSFGKMIGQPVAQIPTPAGATGVWNRAVSIRPGVVERIVPIDMDVVYQIYDLPPDQRFDLVIGTNIFIYYGSLEQSLARNNLAGMIKPGGFLITDEALSDAAPTKLVDSLVTSVQMKPNDLERMFTYARQP